MAPELTPVRGRECHCGYVFGNSDVVLGEFNSSNFYSDYLSSWVKKHAFYKYYAGKDSIFTVESQKDDSLLSLLNKLSCTEAKYSPTYFLGDKERAYYGAPHFIYKFRKFFRKNHLPLPQRKHFLFLASGVSNLEKRISLKQYYIQLLSHHDEHSQHQKKRKHHTRNGDSINITAHECCLCSCCFRQYGMASGCKNPFCKEKAELLENNFVCCVNGTEISERIMLVLSVLHPEITHLSFIKAFAWIIMHYISDEAEIFFILACLISSKHYDYFDQSLLCSYVSSLALMHISHDIITRCSKGVLSHTIIKDFLSLRLPKSYKDGVSVEVPKKFVMSEWRFKLLVSLPLCLQTRLIDSFIIEGPEVFTKVMLYFVERYPRYLNKNFSTNIYNPEIGDFNSLIRRFIEETGSFSLKTVFKTNGRNEKFKYYQDMYLKFVNSGVLDIDDTENFNKPYFRVHSVDIVDKSPVLVHDLHDCSLHIPTSPTTMITDREWAHLEDWMPPRIQLFVPNVLFTTKKHGCNLKTLYHLCELYHPCLLLIHTDKDEVFGAYLTCALKHRHNNSFFGTGETFLFKLRPEIYKYEWIVHKKYKEEAMRKKSQLEAFKTREDKIVVKKKPKFKNLKRHKRNENSDPSPAQISVELINPCSETSNKLKGFNNSLTRKSDTHVELNDLFIAGDDYSLIVGGGGTGFGLQVDANLYNGNSTTCSTFENCSLTNEPHGDFICVRVDVIWFEDKG